MMEFTVSRVAMMICGVILLGAVIVPFTNVMENNEDQHYQTQCDNISDLIDSFYESDTDELIVSMESVMPSPDSTMKFEGHVVKLKVDENEFVSVTKSNVQYSEMIFHDEVIKLTKENNDVVITKMTL